ncbi:MAG: DegV family protein [Ligilactobacillus saerimneri]|nr:DegV family protein [Ligilactobacillus saerimneri]
MTRAIKILTDSSVQLTPAEIEKYNITIIPLSVELEGKQYIDGETITRPELVEYLRRGILPKTSQPALGRFLDLYEQLTADGSEVLAIMMADFLSGTYKTAVAAAEMVDGKVTVINSKSTDRGMAFQVIAAAKDIAAGKSMDEIKAHLTDIWHRTQIDVLVDNLDALVAGGRISKVAGALTKIINIKVIVRVNNDGLGIYAKGRGRKLFLKHTKEIAKMHQDNQIQALSLSNVATDPEFLQRIKDNVLVNNVNKDIPYLAELTSPIIMTHTGMSAVGLITLAEKPEKHE